MKKIFCFSFIAISFGLQSMALAQQVDSPISKEEYDVVLASICNAPANSTPGDILSSVASHADASMDKETVTSLQELALGMFSMPSVEKERLCNQGQLSS